MILPGIEQVAYEKGQLDEAKRKDKKLYDLLLKKGYSEEEAKAWIQEINEIAVD